jgi:hypothetical protein
VKATQTGTWRVSIKPTHNTRVLPRKSDLPDIIIPRTKRRKDFPMKIKINNFRGYRYRRYAVAMKFVATAWVIYSAMFFFAGESLLTFVGALLTGVLGFFPAMFLAAAMDDIANTEFANRK